jgi:hypothetical protein
MAFTKGWSTLNAAARGEDPGCLTYSADLTLEGADHSTEKQRFH